MALSLTSTPESRREAGLDPPQKATSRWRHFVQLAGSYWVSSDWKIAWLLLLGNIATLFTGVYSMVLLNKWQGSFFNALQGADGGAMPRLMVDFAVAITAVVSFQAINILFDSYLVIRWRTWLTQHYLERWLRHQRFHDIERSRLIDNPDQRIAEDINLFTDKGLQLLLGFIRATTNAVVFGIILWNLSGILHFSVGGSNYALPGSLVWAAIAYALIGAFVIILAGRPLIRRTMRQQHYEADFRFGLIHVRRHSEQIAFARSASTEWRGLSASFDLLRSNFVRLIWIRCGVQSVQGIYSQVSAVVPALLMLPRVVAREITLGPVMQARDGFVQFHMAVSWFVQAYPQIAELTATVNRLKALDDLIDHPRPYRIVANVHEGSAIEARGLALSLPDGRHLLDVGDWTVRKGERWTVRGASGTGKSTLLRALAGIWPDGKGEVDSPAAGKIMFVPQKAYFPLGTLKDAICFPADPSTFDDERISGLLNHCRLPELPSMLHEIRPWSEELSPGEQQRLALARVLLHEPDYLFLDEVTSALDTDNASYLYGSIVERLPGLTLVSVVHAEALSRFHTHSFCVVDRRAILDNSSTASSIGDNRND